MRPQAFLKLKREKVAFERREQRSLFLLKRYRRFLKGRILDVGCDRGWLRQLLGESYVGVDRRGLPDVQIDLEKVSFLPFPDDSFDCVLCMDVLEHLDNLEWEALRILHEQGVRVPRIVAFGERKSGNIVLESFCVTRKLFPLYKVVDLFKSKSPEEIIPEMVEVVKAMHDAGVFHRDLHIGNLAVHNGQIYVFDFHRCKIFRQEVPLQDRL